MTAKERVLSLSLKQQLWLGIPLLLSASLVQAKGNLIPHAMASYEQDSNLLMAPDNSPRIDSSGKPQLSDSFQDYSGGLDGEYRWRDNRLYVTSNFSRVVYQHFTELNHSEVAWTTGLDWTATHKVKGNIEAEYDRHLLPFTEVNFSNTGYSDIVTTQGARASATYDMNSHWQAVAGASYTNDKLPDAGIQSYDVNQSRGNAGVNFIGSARLTTGITIDRISAHYINDVVNANGTPPDFTQTSYNYTIDYKLGARSTINGAIGYNKRAQTRFDVSATTGSLVFKQQLTVKTGYSLQFRRSLDSYYSTFGSQLYTEGIVGLNWQATQKILLSANYDRTKAEVTGYLGINNTTLNFDTSAISQRTDYISTVSVSLKYTVLRWLTITPSYGYQNRDSSQPDVYNFTNRTYGISIQARFEP